jgi:excisionase family DNA binding protein
MDRKVVKTNVATAHKVEVIPSRLLPLSRVAEALGVSIYTVRRFVSAGSLPVVQVGAKLMVSSEDVARAQRHGVAKRKLGRSTARV